jgi:hypothetical protein
MSHLLSHLQDLQIAENSGKVLQATVLRTELENTTNAIELALKTWICSLPAAEDGSEGDLADPRIQSIVNNAEAYRQASLIYLYRTIRQHARTSKLVQNHTKLALSACLRVVDWAGPMSALLWPLFVASCEAVEDVDREMARVAFAKCEGRQGMVNIRRTWAVVCEVWQRDESADWREICTERGFSIVFG